MKVVILIPEPRVPLAEVEASYQHLAPLLASLERAKLPRYTLDATWAVIQTRRIIHNVEPFRPAIERLPDFDMGHVDRLPHLANVLTHAHAQLGRYIKPEALPALAAEAARLRTLLLKYADVLVLTGTFAAEVIARVRRGAGYLDLSEDLNVLAAVYLDRPEIVAPPSPVTADDIAQATTLARALGMAAVQRHDDFERDRLRRERAKIGHLLLTARGQVWRAMAYLRYARGDVDRLVPSLYAPRKR